ncbi:MAG TPA: hypothetical protein VMD78_02430 [Candidatus Baltobacteraceae bacterium]|nr:hypothetical protein [Candidatus Baltobacteraceae bacterium]
MKRTEKNLGNLPPASQIARAKSPANGNRPVKRETVRSVQDHVENSCPSFMFDEAWGAQFNAEIWHSGSVANFRFGDDNTAGSSANGNR